MIICCPIVLAILASFSVPDGVSPNESNARESAGSIRLETDDDLSLTLNRSDGTLRSVSIGGREFRADSSPIRFEEVIEDRNAPDLLEVGPAFWNTPADCYEESANGHPGSWMRVSGVSDARPKARVEINQKTPEPLVLSGWCQARVEGEAFGWFNRHLALNANAVYTDGSRMPEVSAYFGQYDHGPQFSRRVICPDRPVESLDLDLSVPGGKCMAWYRGVRLQRASYQVSSPSDAVRRVDNSVHQEFVIEEASLRGMVTYRPMQECVEITCSFESMECGDRAVSAWLSIPLDAVGGVWHDDVRTSRKIEEGGIYRSGAWYGAGRDGWNSRYPFACVETKTGECLAIGTSVAEPRVFQTEYDAARRELRIRFDLGLSPDAGRWANRSSFTAYLFACSDGFRGAAEKYYRVFEWAFRNRVEKQGTWLAFMTPAAIPEHEDFHFQFLESVGHMGWDERAEMYSFRYAEPWIHHQEFPAHLLAPEVHGPADPQTSVSLAKRIAIQDDRSLPLDMRRRYPAYLGSSIEDRWGNPQGYFFRSPTGGRNENMMIVNPNDLLPPPAGSQYSSGGWDREIVRQTMTVSRQWHLPGWTFARVSEHPFIEVDQEHKRSGGQSVRLDPVQGKSYYEQYLRGISQIVRYVGSAEPLSFSYSFRGESVPADGTGFAWSVTLWYDDGTSAGVSFPVAAPGSSWQTRVHDVPTARAPRYVSVSLQTPTWTPDSTVLWIDDVSLRAGGRELLANGGFEEAKLLPCRLDGVYLDTMECYLANLNYRRAHWAYADEPPTFDCGRMPALHQVYSHVTYARRMADWMHSTGRLVFGNCTPATPFAAPYLDVMGTELFWKQGGAWTPWPDAEFNFARFMSRGKPYCVLQYSDLTADEQARYVKRCLFYGVLPSNQAAPSGGWYWADPIVVDRHRPVFKKYLPIIIAIAEAGWQPVTLARTSDPDVWIERFGGGEAFYLTVFNSSGERRTATITLDPRSGAGPGAPVEDVLGGRTLRAPAFEVELGPEDVAVFRVERSGGRP
ncbi:MAG: hypothetical protein KBC96_07195 [Armatimonadetes bacterium]|nr:hypothetical protein [Armatimonadota bacterium]